MSVSYAGLPLTAPNEDVARLIALHGGLDEIMIFQQPSWNGLGGRKADYGHFRAGKLGRLLWPTGASRHAVAHFTASQSQLDTLRQVIKRNLTGDVPATYETLRIWDEENDDGTEVSTYMYMLSPFPLFKHDDADEDIEPLWLLTFVDDRYFWWWRKYEQIVVTPGVTTWELLITNILTGLEAAAPVLPSEIDAGYLKPHYSLSSNFEYLPPLLDAVAYSIGCRVVRQLDGTVVIQKPDTARSVSMDLLEEWREWTVQGGSMAIGDDGEPEQKINLWATAPAKVTLVTPQIDISVLEAESDLADADAFDVNLVDLAITEYRGSQQRNQGSKLVRTTAARWTDADVETNDAEMQALADTWARDWYLWQLADQYRMFGSVVPWDGTGMADYVEWEAWPQLATRVVRGPLNDLADTVWHWNKASGTCPHDAAFDDFFVAEILCSADDSGYLTYSWREKYYTTADGDAVTLPGGRTGYPAPRAEVTVVEAGDDDTAAIQTVELCTPPLLGGTWDLGCATGLAYDVSAATLQAALRAGGCLGVDVVVSGSMSGGFTIVWPSTGGPVSALVPNTSSLRPSESTWAARELNNQSVASGTIVYMRREFVPDVTARVVITKTSTSGPDYFSLYLKGVTGGAWSITWDGETSDDIFYGQIGSELRTIIQAQFMGLTLSTFDGTGTFADPWIFHVTSDSVSHEVSVDCVSLRDGSGFRFHSGDAGSGLCGYGGMDGLVPGEVNVVTVGPDNDCLLAVQPTNCTDGGSIDGGDAATGG